MLKFFHPRRRKSKGHSKPIPVHSKWILPLCVRVVELETRHSVLRTCCKARHYCPHVGRYILHAEEITWGFFIHSFDSRPDLVALRTVRVPKVDDPFKPLLNLDAHIGLGEAGWLFGRWDKSRIPYPRHVKIWRKSKGSVCQGVGVKQAVSSWLGKDHPYSLCFVGTVVQLGSSPVLDF